MFGDAAWEKFSGEEMSTSELFKPLDIEGLIETLFSNLEVYTADGEPIEIAHIDVPSVNKDMLFDTFVFGAVREYAADEYRETASCAGLIEMLYEAVQTGNIQELLSQESIGETELSIAEKLDYIKNEKSGRLAKYDFLHAYAKSDYPTKYYLVEGADDSEDIFMYRLYNFSDEQFYYMWFKCEKDSEGNITAQKGMPMYSSGMNEHYFLSWQGLPYLCIANRNEEGEIESVVLYDFQTPDYIGTLLYINASSVRVCSYIKNEDGYKTENPLYLFDE